VADLEWTLAPGQSAVLRPGDELERARSVPLRFEAGKRVPGAPVSGMAWAEGWGRDWDDRIGLHLTLLLGGLALVRAAPAAARGRASTTLLGAGLVAAFLWAQGWAVYAALGAPDLFLGGPAPPHLFEMRALGGAGPWWTDVCQGLLLAGGLAAFLASTAALRDRFASLDAAAGGTIGRDPALWAAVFGVTGIASLRPVDPWWLVVVALGIGAAALGPGALWPGAGARATAAAAVVGLAAFAVLAAAGELRRAAGEVADQGRLAAAVQAYPALAAAPAGAIALWIGRRLDRRGQRPRRSR
jgi:hypothetical protein